MNEIRIGYKKIKKNSKTSFKTVSRKNLYSDRKHQFSKYMDISKIAVLYAYI